MYCNTGDWVESCSALTENAEGQLSLVYWTALAGASIHPIDEVEKARDKDRQKAA